jgi:hypothetical protein
MAATAVLTVPLELLAEQQPQVALTRLFYAQVALVVLLALQSLETQV